MNRSTSLSGLAFDAVRVIVDTSVAIYLRDDHSVMREAVAALPSAPMMSVLTRVELEGGIYRNPAEATLLRRRVDLLLRIMPELPFTTREAAIYGKIVDRCGCSRARVVDRMIAATAVAEDATLITINGSDFRDIPDLKLEVWPSPG